MRLWLADQQLIDLDGLLEASPQAIDAVLIAYVQWLYNEEAPISWGRMALAAIQLVRLRLRGELRGAWAALRHWQRQDEQQTRVPIPPDVL